MDRPLKAFLEISRISTLKVANETPIPPGRLKAIWPIWARWPDGGDEHPMGFSYLALPDGLAIWLGTF